MLKPSILVVIGPTASGKSELAVKLAKQLNGEIISADSRQIYRGLDIGSGKVTGNWIGQRFIYKSVQHYLIDEANPKLQYSVAKFQKRANKIIHNIIKRGKLPIICGGTALWVDAVVFGQVLPQAKPNLKLRRELNKLSTEQLFTKLNKLDPKRADSIDKNNPRRLLRALEIVMSTGKPVPAIKLQPTYNTIWLGLNPQKTILESKIQKRLKQRLKQGLIAEVERLHENGLSWSKLEAFGLEYKFCALYLQGKFGKSEMEKLLFTAIKQYAKRQMTWWKRNPEIHWSESPEKLLSLAKTLRT